MPTTRSTPLLIATILVACTTEDEPYRVVIDARDTSLVLGRDGDGAWQRLTPDANGEAAFDVTSGHHAYAVFCAAGAVRVATVQHSTSAGRFSTPCARTGDSVTISGITVPGALVFGSGDLGAIAGGDGRYQLSVTAGTVDLVAVQPERSMLMIARSLDATADRVIDLPIATSGIAMLRVVPTVSGATAAVTVFSDLTTSNGTAAPLGDHPTSVAVPPASALLLGDRVVVGARAANCTTQTSNLATPTLIFPGPYSADVDHTSVRWGAPSEGAWDYHAVNLIAGAPDARSIIFIGATRGWLDTTGSRQALAMVDVTKLPGWESSFAGIAPGEAVDALAWSSHGDPTSDYAVCSSASTVFW